MLNFKRIGILGHPLRPDTAPIAQKVAESLAGHDVEIWVRTDWDASDVGPLIH